VPCAVICRFFSNIKRQREFREGKKEGRGSPREGKDAAEKKPSQWHNDGTKDIIKKNPSLRGGKKGKNAAGGGQRVWENMKWCESKEILDNMLR